MVNKKDKQNKIRISEEMVPRVVGDEEVKSIKVKVEGHMASCFLHDRIFNSMKIVLLFDQLHPRWGECFTTKYFQFDHFGNLHWGHNGEFFALERL